ncbi:MAG: hypothetical protein IMZ71_01835 [Chloroflexi bacterium]|nr:hypothetical protein [Chloroflexota bacterium]
MRETLNKLWTAFFVAVLLVVPALVISGLLGPQAGLTLWMMGIAAHQPVLWVKNNLSFNRRFAIWFSASVVGGVTYLGVEALAASLLWSGNVSSGLRLGFAANLIGVMVAPVVGGVLVRCSSSSRHASSPLAATRQSTQSLERQTSVSCEEGKDESRTQSGAASVASLRVRATARERANVALREAKPSTKRGWGRVLFALSLVAAILVASLGKSIGRSIVSRVEHRYRQ